MGQTSKENTARIKSLMLLFMVLKNASKVHQNIVG